MLTCNDCIHSEVCVRQKIYGEYSITECKGHFLGKEDVVEVVCCKNCKLFQPYEWDEHKGECAKLAGFINCVYEYDFCSYGVKRSEGK